MNKLHYLFIFLIGILVIPVQAANSPLQSELSAYKVVSRNGQEALDAAAEVEPGDVLQYVLNYKNTGTLPITELIVLGPIPEGTNYLKDSQITKSSTTFEASADKGRNWGPPPLYRDVIRPDGSVERQIIPESQYTEIRWKLLSPLLAGKEADFIYRVKVIKD